MRNVKKHMQILFYLIIVNSLHHSNVMMEPVYNLNLIVLNKMVVLLQLQLDV